MSYDALEFADRVWRGEVGPEEQHPFFYIGELIELQPGLAFVPSFANVTAFATAQGLVLIDSGGFLTAPGVQAQLRRWSAEPVHTIIFSHGHVDHVCGASRYDEEAAANGWKRPHVVAHEAVVERFERYSRTAGYNGRINARQFQLPDLSWPTSYRMPDETYHTALTLEVGEQRFELRHARGETDDHTWIWAAERRVLCCGDLFIWTFPNAGNPQKAQRYPDRWAATLRSMATLDAETLLPGHGPPLTGSARIRTALGDTATVLELLCEQTLELMNAGARLNELLCSVSVPQALLDKPYLRPLYDEPEFVVRNLWRLYGGWYDGNPANLKPADDQALAREFAALAGGAERLAQRARELAAAGELRLAGHLAELGTLAAPDSLAAHAARAEVYTARAASESSTMARGIFASAAAESRRSGAAGGEASA